jgi:GntR family transcriptional regulator, regulator for abcA and norABC
MEGCAVKTRSVNGQTDKFYAQAYHYIADRIDRGVWMAHDKLPSVRMLAQELNMHRLTVFRAYQLLKQNRIVYVKEKSGYYVSTPRKQSESPFESQSSQAILSSGRMNNNMASIQQVPVDYQLSQALIDPNLLPNVYLSDYVKKVFDMYPKMISTYSTLQGDQELRESLCSHISRQIGVPVAMETMTITTGAQQAIDLLARIFVRPMDAVLVERPTYSAAIDIFRQHGARFLPVDIGPNGYDMGRVEELMKQHRPKIFYLNPTFHNPTGFTLPAAARKRLVELAERYQCLLIEDDVFHDMYFEQPPPPPLFAYDTEGWVVYVRSFSKYVAPGLRICAVVGSKSVTEQLVTAKSLADNGTPLVNQKIFLHFFQSERMKQHIEKLRTALQMRRDIMEEGLTATGWQWSSPNGGLNLWIRLPAPLDGSRLLSESLRQSVSFVPGTICDPLGEMTSYIRLSFSYMNEKHIQEGVRLLREAAKLI